jgi:hypothetical protein
LKARLQSEHILSFLPVKETEDAAGPAGASTVRDDMHVTARHEEVGGTRFDETRRRTKVLDLSRIGGCGNQHRIPTRLRWAMHIRQQRHSVAHGHRNIVILRHRMYRL